MQEIFNNSGKIIGFLVLLMIIQISMGDKVAQNIELLILFSMCILNYQAFNSWLQKTF